MRAPAYGGAAEAERLHRLVACVVEPWRWIVHLEGWGGRVLRVEPVVRPTPLADAIPQGSTRRA